MDQLDVRSRTFRQGETVIGLAQEATNHGADWIIAIDADEFWSTSTRPLRDVLDTQQVAALVCEGRQLRPVISRGPRSASETEMIRSDPSRPTSGSRRRLLDSGR